MIKKSWLFSIFFLFAITMAWGEGVISSELQKLLDNERNQGSIRVIISLKEQFDIATIQQAHSLRGDDVKKQVCEILKEKTALSQHWLRDYIKTEVRNRQIEKPNYFWLVNAVCLSTTPDVIRELAQRPEIKSIQLNVKQVMIDPIKSEESDRASSAWGVNYIKADKTWSKGVNGEGITVAVVDTGIDLDHPGFASGQILVELSKSFVEDEPDADDQNGHGTHCAGTVGSPKYGVAPGVKIIGVKVLDGSGSGTWESVAKGVEYAMEHAQVISMSLGGTASEEKNVVEEVVEKAIDSGVVCAIAAGNSGWGLNKIGTPGIVVKAITVGAIYRNGGLTSFSSQGPTIRGDDKPDIVAPGADVPSLWLDGGTNSISGTSMATPHVAGLAALVLSRHGKISPQAVKDIITNQNNTFGTKKKNTYGNGIVDAEKCCQ